MVVERASANRLSSFDKALKSFKYHEAFDAALINGSPDIVVAVIEELVQRNGLRIALQGRDQHTLEPVVAFLVRQITAPPFAAVLIGVANLLLDMYAPVLGKSAAIDELFVKLRNTLEAEMRLQARACPRLRAHRSRPRLSPRLSVSLHAPHLTRADTLGLAGRVGAANGRNGRAARRSHAHRRREAAASPGHPPARPRGPRLPARRRGHGGNRKVNNQGTPCVRRSAVVDSRCPPLVRLFRRMAYRIGPMLRELQITQYYVISILTPSPSQS